MNPITKKKQPNTTLQDIRPEGNLQADDEIIIPQDDLYKISWETDCVDFPRNADSKNTSDDSSADSDQQDNLITDLDLPSIRQITRKNYLICCY